MSGLMGVGGFGRRRVAAPAPDLRAGGRAIGAAAMPQDVVLAVRLDWPDGTHEFVGPEPDEAQAVLRLAGEHGKWRRSPWRPRLSVVAMSEAALFRHARERRDCTDPGCATAGVQVVYA